MGDHYPWKSPSFLITIIFFCILLAPYAAVSGTCVEIAGDSLPAVYSVAPRGIFDLSDSLYVGDSLLRRGTEYNYDNKYMRFDLSRITVAHGDTLRLCYTLLPSWLSTTYGRSLPPIGQYALPETRGVVHSGKRNLTSRGSDLSLSGTKSFRFMTRSRGGSSFSQGLDLTISGQLASGVDVTGAVSDRGYDPIYGTANSTLKELDRIHLEVNSRRFTGRVGDLMVSNRFDPMTQMPFTRRDRRLSGVTFAYRDFHQSAYMSAARPRGRFQTIRLHSLDQLQGPYQIDPAAVPVVPGSEQVWLDGQLLERGTHKDYIVDYPAGQITFGVNHSIDSRSRIEIDYEPQSSDYRGELFTAGGGVALGDSTVIFDMAWTHDGDDSHQPLQGELSEAGRALLEAVGDNSDAARESGVFPDSMGNYIILPDSLPDTIYQHIVGDTGDYRVTFSFVGVSKGEYRYVGNAIYQYAGEGKGDYLPVRTLPLPERNEYFQTSLGIRSGALGTLTAEWRQSQSDKNLFSDLDDDDNNGALYVASLRKDWGPPDNTQYVTARTRFREPRYRSPHRLDKADFARDFFLPDSFVMTSDESYQSIEGRLSPSSHVAVSPNLARLDYQHGPSSWRGGGDVEIMAHRNVTGRLKWRMIRIDGTSAVGTSTADTSAVDTRPITGRADSYGCVVAWKVPLGWTFSTDYEHDDRRHDYKGEDRGTRYDRLSFSLDRPTERLEVQRYIEDTLRGDWNELLRRTHVSVESRRRIGKLSYNTTLFHQWRRSPQSHDESYLGRLNLDYNDSPGRFRVGSSYLLSEESRHARGINYLRVESGEGQYIFEEEEYRPDPNGDFVRIEEILSTQAQVSRGEKTFHLSRDWSIVLLRLDSRVREELLASGQRSVWWVLPFVSDQSQPYLYYNRHHSTDLRLFPIKNIYAVSLSVSEDQEIRRVADTPRERRDRRGSLSFRQVVGSTRFEETVGLFDSDRDIYFSGAGEVDGYSIDLTIRQLMGAHELTLGTAYRRATSAVGERSDLYRLLTSSRLGFVGNGELRISLELYRQTLSALSGMPSFLLTDNRPGRQGAVWSVGVRYGGKSRLRINLSISGRHADTRAARIIGQGEMVAGF
ncbi:MAG: hypothetical protein KOO62_11850 [candidate division Zixibacteria bacterium]|nr:hypothetical protein [candidate division Zixibacteria bacterium]